MRKGGRKAEIYFVRESPPVIGGITPQGTEYRRSHHRILGTQEYLNDRGDVFTMPGTDSTNTFYHSVLVITDACKELFLGQAKKTYMEK